MAIQSEAPRQGPVGDQSSVVDQKSARPTKTISRRNFLIGAGVGGAGLLTAAGLAAVNQFGNDNDLENQAPQGGVEPSANPKAPSVLGGETVLEATPTPEAVDPNALRELASKRGVDVGFQLIPTHLRNSAYRELMANNSNLVSLGSTWDTVSPQFIPALRPNKDEFNFSDMDKGVDFAQKNGIKVQGNGLVWGHFLPKWLTSGNYSKSELTEIFENHIGTVVDRYNGDKGRKIDQWVVVNEPVAAKRGWGDPLFGFWYKNLGYEFVNDRAFDLAGQASKGARLILNESFYNHGQGNNVTDILVSDVASLARFLVAKGHSIAIGMQMHVRGDSLPLDRFEKDMKLFKDIAGEVVITEFDIDMSGVKGTPEERAARLAFGYDEISGRYLNAGGKNLLLFGPTDNYSWYAQDKPNADATLFDRNLKKKPAYDMVKARIEALPIAPSR